MTTEKAIFDYLREVQLAASDQAVIKLSDIHDSIYQKFSNDIDTGIRIGNAISVPVPQSNGTIKDHDSRLLIVCYARVKGSNKNRHADPRELVNDLANEVITAFYDDCSLGGRVCQLRVFRKLLGRDAANNADPYAVVNIPVVANPSGEILPDPYN